MQEKKTLLFSFYLSFSILGYFLFCFLQVHTMSLLANLSLYVAGFCTVQALDIIFEFKNKMKYMLIGLVLCFAISFICTYDIYGYGEAWFEIILNGAAVVAFVVLVIALIVKSRKRNIYD